MPFIVGVSNSELRQTSRLYEKITSALMIFDAKDMNSKNSTFGTVKCYNNDTDSNSVP